MAGYTIAQALVESAQTLRKAGISDSRRDAATLLANVIGRDATFLIAHADAEVSISDLKLLRDYTERRAAAEPLQYILGGQDFFNLRFEVAPGVLIPRPETENLVEKALDLIDPDNSTSICDVGTGSGCIIISLLHDRKEAKGLALDISQRALEIAKRNADRLEVTERVEFRQSDGFSAVAAKEGFDLIVSNPPYVSETEYATLQREVRDHEPVEALISGPRGLNMIDRLIREAGAFLNPNGHLLFEIGFNQESAVKQLVSRSHWTMVEILNDLQGIPRTVVLKKPV